MAVLTGTVATASPAAASDVQVCGFRVDNVMWDKFVSRFGQFSACPTTNSALTPNRLGLYVHFNNGASVYWKTSQSGAQPYIVEGLIRGKWADLGWEASYLGFPITDELTTFDGVGRFNHFEGGSVYWSPQTDAHVVKGDIFNKWASLGWEAGILRYPTTDETATPDTVGRYNHFQGGSIYWKPNLGAHEIHGWIRHTWANQGWEQGPLGYPISDEQASSTIPANRFNEFENGILRYSAALNTTDHLAPAFTVSATSVLAEIQQGVGDWLGSSFYFRGALSFANQLDYAIDGSGTVHNRKLRVNVPLGYVIVGGPDAEVNLVIDVEIERDPAVFGKMTNRTWTSHVPFPSSITVSGSDVSSSLQARIDRFLNRWWFVWDPNLPSPLHVKVMADNTIRVFRI